MYILRMSFDNSREPSETETSYLGSVSRHEY